MKRAVLVAALVIIGCVQRTPDVAIWPGLHPKLTPAAAELLARDAIAAQIHVSIGRSDPPDAVAISAIPGGPTVGGYLAGVSWIVELRGEFILETGRPSLRNIQTAPAGAFRLASGVKVQISDDDGSVISVDFED